MDDAITRAIREGKLVETTLGHSRESAQLDREREVYDSVIKPEKSVGAVAPRPAASTLVRGRVVPIWSPSTTALHLGRLGRLGRMRGVGSELLNAEAALIEQWLESQMEAAKAALEVLQACGVQMQNPCWMP